MEKRQFTILLSLFVALTLVILGISVLFGTWDEKKVSRVTIPIQWKGNFAYLTMKFSSNSSIFSTGDTIQVKPIIFYPTNGSDPQLFIINFPNTMSPSDYQNLVKLQDDLKVNQTNTSISYQLPAISYYALYGAPLSNQFNLVWTNEGEKSANFSIIFHNKTAPITIPLSNIINIESSDIRIQIANGNLSLGLTLIIAGLTIITIIPTIDLLLVQKKK